MAVIGLDAQSTLGHSSGIGRYTSALLAALPAAAPEHDYVALHLAGDPVMRTDRRLRWQQFGLARAGRRARVDVLHVTGFDAPLRSQLPVVLTVHDLAGRQRPQDLPPVSRWYWARWLPSTIHRADAVIAVSESTRRELAACTRLAPDAVTVIPPGVDHRFHPVPHHERSAVLDRHGVDAPYVLFVGAAEARKGLDTLLASFAVVCRRHPHHLVLVGTRSRGWKADPAVAPDRLHVLGYVADADLPALYAGADVVALPSRHEGFGFPVVEAMACGTPVVTSGAAALPETAGGAALQVPPDEPAALAGALDAVLGDPALAASLAARGLMRAERFSWHEAAARTAAVYERVLARHGGEPAR